MMWALRQPPSDPLHRSSSEFRHYILAEVPASSRALPNLNKEGSTYSIGARADNVTVLVPQDANDDHGYPPSAFLKVDSEVWLKIDDQWVYIEVKTSMSITGSLKQIFATIRALVDAMR
jgi:hypothetical protein